MASNLNDVPNTVHGTVMTRSAHLVAKAVNSGWRFTVSQRKKNVSFPNADQDEVQLLPQLPISTSCRASDFNQLSIRLQHMLADMLDTMVCWAPGE